MLLIAAIIIISHPDGVSFFGIDVLVPDGVSFCLDVVIPDGVSFSFDLFLFCFDLVPKGISFSFYMVPKGVYFSFYMVSKGFL